MRIGGEGEKEVRKRSVRNRVRRRGSSSSWFLYSSLSIILIMKENCMLQRPLGCTVVCGDGHNRHSTFRGNFLCEAV